MSGHHRLRAGPVLVMVTGLLRRPVREAFLSLRTVLNRVPVHPRISIGPQSGIAAHPKVNGGFEQILNLVPRR